MKASRHQNVPVTASAPEQSGERTADHVWVLTGSIGALTAIGRFLSAVSPGLPLTFIVAIRISSDGIPLVVNLIQRSTAYRVQAAEPGYLPCRGEVVVMPVDEPLVIGTNGRLRAVSGRVALEGPTVDDILCAMAGRYGERAGAIIFSGIGMEGVRGCQALTDAGGQVWVQEASSCQFSSMPASIRELCKVAYSASPERLAARLSASFPASEQGEEESVVYRPAADNSN